MHARRLLDKGVPPDQAYWLRAWALRGLLLAGPGDDLAPLGSALRDECWRVREMACKVVARHRLGDLLDECAELRNDTIGRVRDAAAMRQAAARYALLADTALVDASGLSSGRSATRRFPSGSVHLAPKCDGLAIPSAGRYQ